MMTYYQMNPEDENPIELKSKIFFKNVVKNAVYKVSAICPGLVGWFPLQRASVWKGFTLVVVVTPTKLLNKQSNYRLF